MFRFIKWLGTIVGLVVVGFFSLQLYFLYINPVATKVRGQVMDRVQMHNIHYVSYNQIPETFRNAIIATEDRSFFQNPGIDPIGISRSLFIDVQKDSYVQGGSTITQQLIRNTLLNQNKTIYRKLLELFYSIGLYLTSSKKETFELYANDIYFGHGAYGMYNASETYFSKPPSALNDGEQTLLAGLPNAPSLYDPFQALKLARERQKIVVSNMVDDGIITQTKAGEILKQPIELKHNESEKIHK